MTPVGSEEEWLAALEHVPKWSPPRLHTIVLAPHPDDETLGAGRLIASQRSRGVPVTVMAVTDGEAAYAEAEGLGALRHAEQEAALAELGVERRDILRLHLRDGAVAASEDVLVRLLKPVVKYPGLLVAPWSRDLHPDHEACGRAAERIARLANVELVSDVFWTWHSAPVESLTALPLARLELEKPIQTALDAALSQHRSQLEWKNGNPILPASLLKPAQRSFETFIINA
jgi:LmbE family N-acetylglucosaminyl deacetylase